jgi:hypothetical protein
MRLCLFHVGEERVHFSLIVTPALSGYFVIPVGALVFILGLLRMYSERSGGTYEYPGKITLDNIHPALLFVVGFLLFAAGAGGLIAHNDQTFARWVGKQMPQLISEADQEVSMDLNGMPLREVVAGTKPNSLYRVTLAPEAAGIPVKGTFDEALCDADLLAQICGKLAHKLVCRTDTRTRTIHICAKASPQSCQQ